MVDSECPGCRAAQAGIAELEAGILQLEGQLRYRMDKLDSRRPPQLTPDLPVGTGQETNRP